MPAKPSYALRLKPAIEELQKSAAPWIGRRDLENVLGVSKTVACGVSCATVRRKKGRAARCCLNGSP